jgi:hypothetical protein
MKKIQRLWLMLLSTVLLLGALVTLLLSIDWTRETCIFNGVEYSSGEEIVGYLENAECICNSKGKIDCQMSNRSKSFLDNSDFTTKGLEFNAKFLNSLSNAEVNISDEVVFRSVSQGDDGLLVIIEKLDLCTTTKVIPEQVGFFNLDGTELVLTSIKSGDPSRFSEPCIVENSFLLSSVKSKLKDEFKIYFRTENDEVYLANMCVYEGRIHNEGDTYRSDDLSKLCSCKSGESVCEDIE